MSSITIRKTHSLIMFKVPKIETYKDTIVFICFIHKHTQQKPRPMDLLETTELDLNREYLKSLTEKELKSYEIAKDHLGSSFQLEKSNGFREWSKKYQKKETEKTQK